MRKLLCPNESTTLKCVVTPSASNVLWSIRSPIQSCQDASILLTVNPYNCSNASGECGSFRAYNEKSMSGDVCTTSGLTVIATPYINGSIVECYGSGVYQKMLITSYQLIVIGKASACTHACVLTTV